MYSYRKSTHTPLKHNSGHNCVWSHLIHVDSCALKVSSHNCVRSCIFKLCVQHCSYSYSHIPLYAMHFRIGYKMGEKKKEKETRHCGRYPVLTTLITAPKRIHVFPIFILSYLFSLFVYIQDQSSSVIALVSTLISFWGKILYSASWSYCCFITKSNLMEF